MAKAMGKIAPKKSMATTSDPVPEYVCPHCGKTKKKSEFYVKICCDFKKLERACGHYDPNYIPKKKK